MKVSVYNLSEIEALNMKSISMAGGGGFKIWCWWRCEVALTPLTYWCMTFFGWVGFWSQFYLYSNPEAKFDCISFSIKRERRSWSGSARSRDDRGTYSLIFILSSNIVFMKTEPFFNQNYFQQHALQWQLYCIIVLTCTPFVVYKYTIFMSHTWKKGE